MIEVIVFGPLIVTLALVFICAAYRKPTVYLDVPTPDRVVTHRVPDFNPRATRSGSIERNRRRLYAKDLAKRAKSGELTPREEAALARARRMIAASRAKPA